jgi:hypothetical protein
MFQNRILRRQMMTMIRTTAALLGATALGATAALAQTMAPGASPPPTQQQTTPQQTTPQTATTPTTSATLTNAQVTDSDVNQFATAVLAVQKIEGDTSVADADKQKHMAGAVKQAGLTPQKYNAIAKASQADPALMKRIQTAAAAQMQAAPAASAGAAPDNAAGG